MHSPIIATAVSDNTTIFRASDASGASQSIKNNSGGANGSPSLQQEMLNELVAKFAERRAAGRISKDNLAQRPNNDEITQRPSHRREGILIKDDATKQGIASTARLNADKAGSGGVAINNKLPLTLKIEQSKDLKKGSVGESTINARPTVNQKQKNEIPTGNQNLENNIGGQNAKPRQPENSEKALNAKLQQLETEKKALSDSLNEANTAHQRQISELDAQMEVLQSERPVNVRALTEELRELQNKNQTLLADTKKYKDALSAAKMTAKKHSRFPAIAMMVLGSAGTVGGLGGLIAMLEKAGNDGCYEEERANGEAAGLSDGIDEIRSLYAEGAIDNETMNELFNSDANGNPIISASDLKEGAKDIPVTGKDGNTFTLSEKAGASAEESVAKAEDRDRNIGYAGSGIAGLGVLGIGGGAALLHHVNKKNKYNTALKHSLAEGNTSHKLAAPEQPQYHTNINWMNRQSRA